MVVQTRSVTRRLALEYLGSRVGIEIIAHVASFLSVGGGDVMNVCLTVGPEGASVVRYAYLHDNASFLRQALSIYINNSNPNISHRKRKCKERIEDWMAINPDWRRFCTPELMKSDNCNIESSTEGTDTYCRYCPAAAIFNNPAVAIEFGLLCVLRHLVEDQKVDINGYLWNNFTTAEPTHLLGVAMQQEDRSCFHYLLTTESINVGSKCFPDSECSLIAVASVQDAEFTNNQDMLSCVSPQQFQALVEHPSFRPIIVGRRALMHAAEAFASDHVIKKESPTRIEKMKVLMNSGVDPNRTISLPDGTTLISPIEYVKNLLTRIGEDPETDALCHNSETGRVVKDVLTIMKKWGASNNDDE